MLLMLQMLTLETPSAIKEGEKSANEAPHSFFVILTPTY